MTLAFRPAHPERPSLSGSGHMVNVGTLGEIGAYDQYEQEVRKAHDRARCSEKSIVREILRRQTEMKEILRRHGRA